MERLPFSFDRPLAETIKSKFLKDALRWVGDFRDPASSNLLGAKTGNLWGVGYGLLCLLKARQIYLTDGDFPGDFDTKAANAVQFLLDRASFGRDDCNWDNNVWDTAVICRALLYYTQEYPRQSKEKQVRSACLKAIHWLCQQVEIRDQKRYTLGAPDLAQTLRTLVTARKLSAEGQLEGQDLLPGSSLDKVLDVLLSEVIHSAEIKGQSCDGHEEQVAIWDDDVFATADAVISLSRFMQLANSQHVLTGHVNTISTLLPRALRYLELEQVDGKWGIEETTTISLQAYVLGSSVLGPDREPEPHIAFKAIRYLCDPKTVFSDGSIAHKMEPTTYMILAFLEVLENWALPNNMLHTQSVMDLYDYVVWPTPARSTHERVRRMEAQSEADMLRMQNGTAAEAMQRAKRQIGWWRTTAFALGWLIIGYITARFCEFININELGSSLFPTFRWQITNWEVLLAFVALWAGLGWFIYDRILRWSAAHA